MAVKNRFKIPRFAADLAASAENAVADLYFTEEMDSLKQAWHLASLTSVERWCWLNPPFSDIEPWVKKATIESHSGAHTIMLVPASVGANWWRDWVGPYSFQLFLNGRLTFIGETTPYPKDCALLIYAPFQLKGSEVWDWRTRVVS
jgi:DNA (cytosine-5)-methyltransferase 1